MDVKNRTYLLLINIIFLLLLFKLTQLNIYWNWDTEAYLGLMLQSAHPEWNIFKLHQETMQIFTHLAPPKRFDIPPQTKIPNLKNYYSYILTSPLIFKEELALFNVKPAYQGMVLLLYKLGFSISNVFILVNTIGAYLGTVYFMKILKNIVKSFYLQFILILIVLIYFLPSQALYNVSPDMLSCGFGMMFLYFVLNKWRWEAAWEAVLVILCRPDYIFFVLFLLLVIPKPVSLKVLKRNALFTLLPLFFYALIQYFNTISWNTLITNQFFQPVLYIESAPMITPVEIYINFMLHQLPGNILHSPVLGISFLSFAYCIFSFIRKRYYTCLVISGLLANIYLHFAFFPSFSGRMMLFMYLSWFLVLALLYTKNKILIH